MRHILSLIVILSILAYVFYQIRQTETFDNITYPNSPPGHGLRHPEKDAVSSMINSYLGNPQNAGPNAYSDPKTIANLKNEILPKGYYQSQSDQIKVAYNDVAAYRPGGYQPFNISDGLVSETIATDPVYNSDMFHNNYYSLWKQDVDDYKGKVTARAKDIISSGKNCLNFNNVNQCMSECTKTNTCTGFYVDSVPNSSTKTPGKCCMMLNPSITDNKNFTQARPSSLDDAANLAIVKLIRKFQESDGKLVFDFVRMDKDNSMYKTDVPREQCKSMCPKCILGRCPADYRCSNLLADPRYNFSCLIGNNDLYDEKTGRVFDGPNVPYLDAKYQLNEYAGYNRADSIPNLSVPESERYYLLDRVLPTNDELQSAFVAYDEEHIGPMTLHPHFDKTYDVLEQSNNPQSIEIRGGNNVIGKYNRVVPTSRKN